MLFMRKRSLRQIGQRSTKSWTKRKGILWPGKCVHKHWYVGVTPRCPTLELCQALSLSSGVVDTNDVSVDSKGFVLISLLSRTASKGFKGKSSMY